MITIIGAGPIGCFLAERLAKAGRKVRILEEHKEIGRPVQCTGLVTEEIGKLVNVKELKDKGIIINEIRRIEVVAPNGKRVIIPAKEYVIARDRFDSYFADKANTAGAEIVLGKRIKKKDIKKLEKESDIIIGADGPNSIIRGILNRSSKEKPRNYIGVQAVIKAKIKDPAKYTVFFGKGIAPGFFAWIVPESHTKARVGLASLSNPALHFSKFLDKLKYELGPFKIVEKQGGLIPIFDPKLKLANKENSMFIIGDAACQVKATTGGGLIPGFCAAKELSEAILSKKAYKPKIASSLLVHLLLRRMFDKFSDKDYCRLIAMISNRKLAEILRKENRDSPLRLLLRILAAKPMFGLLAIKAMLNPKYL